MDPPERARFERTLLAPLAVVPKPPAPVDPGIGHVVDRRALPPPAWWHGEDEAAEMALEVWKHVDEVTVVR